MLIANEDWILKLEPFYQAIIEQKRQNHYDPAL